jgi:adenylosuccinate synthase
MAESEAYIVCGLAFGDEGKGTVTDFLCRTHDIGLVVRHNGGLQAAHRVVAADGTEHVFRQFGAGSLVSGVRTLLSKYVVISPADLVAESLKLEELGVAVPYDSIRIDASCTVVTPLHQMVGQLNEVAKGESRIGSCGKGFGQAVTERECGLGIAFGDLFYPVQLKRKLSESIKRHMAEAAELMRTCDDPEMREIECFFADKIGLDTLLSNYSRATEWLANAPCFDADILSAAVSGGEKVVFEGAQGALLHRERGFVPYITRSRTTAENAQELWSISVRQRTAQKIGVFRPYGHRHGPGPFITEDADLPERFADQSNPENRWQGRFRLGHLDLVALRYGISLNGGVDTLAITNLDRLSGCRTIRVCVSYDCRSRGRLDGWTDSDLPNVIANCSPGEWREFPGWDEDLSVSRGFRDLPRNAQAFLEFLSGDNGLRTPIGIVSVGPRSDQKFTL